MENQTELTISTAGNYYISPDNGQGWMSKMCTVDYFSYTPKTIENWFLQNNV